MDDFRVSSTSPYAQDPERRHPDSGKRRKRNPSGEEPPEDDQIVLSSAEPDPIDEDIVDTYTPGQRSES
jgi:hypothetical protein